jgi:hypothetical protein
MQKFLSLLAITQIFNPENTCSPGIHPRQKLLQKRYIDFDMQTEV